MKRTRLLLLSALVISASTVPVPAAEISSALQAKIDTQVSLMKQWAAADAVVAAVKAQNATKPADAAAMTQEKWAAASVLDPFVRAFTKNDAATLLKGKKGPVVSEAFVSSADGTKVAFLSKPTNWCHKGKPKHDVPMTGKSWQGTIEVDESSGVQQLQVAVPVLDGAKAIGSLVVGLNLAELQK